MDLEVIWEERRAWVATMMAKDGPDPAACCEAVAARFRENGSSSN